MGVILLAPGDRKLVPADPSKTNAPRVVAENSSYQVVSESQPYVQITEAGAGITIPAHSHARTEVTVILSGSVRIDGREYPAGSILIVPADTSYSLEVGPDEPVTFVAIREEKGGYHNA